jgi:hypothetical protein
VSARSTRLRQGFASSAGMIGDFNPGYPTVRISLMSGPFTHPLTTAFKSLSRLDACRALQRVF